MISFARTNIIISLFIVIGVFKLSAQEQYTFPLSEDYNSLEDSNINLAPLQNEIGQTGSFSSYDIPSSTCSDNTETIGGFSFEKNAGLMFSNNDFIDCEYTISFTFQIDSLVVRESREGSPGTDWVHLLSFEHIDDHGIYIRVNSGEEGTGTLDFWPNGTVGTDNFFNTSDLYELTLVRNCSGIVRVFVNGNVFDSYDDSASPEYLPGDSDDAIVFFRDRPSAVLDDEASSGFVRSVVIANSVWSDAEIRNRADNFCNTLIDLAFTVQDTCALDQTQFTLTPDVSDADLVTWDFDDPDSGTENTSNVINPTHTFSAAGTYQVSATVNYSGVDVTTIQEVEIQALPDLNLGNDTTLLPNTFLLLDVTDLGINFLWNDGSINSTFTVTQDGTYGVEVTNASGCLASDSITVTYGQYEITVPTVFTPNGDAENDIWIIEGLDNFPNNEIYIYDRLGNEVQFLPQYINTWDGSSLPEGTYFYRIVLGPGREEFGSVSIIR